MLHRSPDESDFEDDQLDEGPSSEDLERLDHEAAVCPDCGAAIWDDAEVCPKCFAFVGGDVARRPPRPAWVRLGWALLLVAAVIIVSLICFMSPALNEARLPR